MANERTFRNIVELSPFPVYVCSGENMIITVANKATLTAWGKDKSVIGKSFLDALPELKDQPFSSLIKHVYLTGETYYTNNDRADLIVDGILQTFYFKFTYQPLYNENDEIEGVLCFATDVTELERARQTVEKQTQNLHNMIKQAPIGICMIDVDGLKVQVVNNSYLNLVGKNPDELINKCIWEGVPEAADYYGPILNEVIETGKTYHAKEHEVMLVRNNLQEVLFLDFVYEPISDIDEKITSIMVIAIDVTDKVFARRKIEDAEERARLAIDAAEIGTFDINLNTSDLLTSDRFNKIFGLDHPISWDGFVNMMHPDDVIVRQMAHNEALKSEKLLYEARIIWEDESVHWIRVQAKIYFNDEGKPYRMLGTAIDITEYKRLQQQKDDFISVVSHELKTPMTSVKASMQLLDRLIKTDPNSPKASLFMAKANTNLAKMQQLVESLLNVSKITSGQLGLQKSTFNVAQMIEESCDHIRLTELFEIIVTGDKDLEVFADKYKIDQVVVNLVNNAVKYAPESRKINVHISKTENEVKISVQDFGPGILTSKIPHLFERYYRVDQSGIQYSGLGLGLYICADIIQRHDGKIGVESEMGEGSTFWFTLPLQD